MQVQKHRIIDPIKTFELIASTDLLSYPVQLNSKRGSISNLRFGGITDTEIHFHLFAIVSVKWLSDMRVINKIRSQIWCTPCSEADRPALPAYPYVSRVSYALLLLLTLFQREYSTGIGIMGLGHVRIKGSVA